MRRPSKGKRFEASHTHGVEGEHHDALGARPSPAAKRDLLAGRNDTCIASHDQNPNTRFWTAYPEDYDRLNQPSVQERIEQQKNSSATPSRSF